MITIGCDPGSTTGIAVWRDERLVLALDVKHGRMDVDVRVRTMREVRKVVDGWGDDVPVFVAEAQFLGRRSDEDERAALGRVSAAFSVADIASRYEELAMLYGFRVAERVYPATWRSTFGLAGKVKDKGARAVDLVRSRVKLMRGTRPSEHVAEAVLIGLSLHAARYEQAGVVVPSQVAWALLERMNRRARNAGARGSKGR